MHYFPKKLNILFAKRTISLFSEKNSKSIPVFQFNLFNNLFNNFERFQKLVIIIKNNKF